MDERVEDERERSGRGGNSSAIRGLLSREVVSGPAHWGGQRPRRTPPPEPVDVAGGPLPGGLPETRDET